MNQPHKLALLAGLGFTAGMLYAFEYNAADVTTAFQRHDLRKLQTLAMDADKPVRLSALESLVRLNDPQVARFMMAQLDDSDPDIVQTALWSLPAFGPQAATQPVIARVSEAERHPSVDVRKAAVIVLEDLKDADKTQQMRDALLRKDLAHHQEALAYFIDRKDQSILIAAHDMLEGPDPVLKQTGIFLVHGLDDHDHLGDVIKLLKDPAPPVRSAAVLLVGDWKETAAIENLGPLLQDPDPLVRASAISILGKHQDPAISTALSGLTAERVPAVRIVLAKALGQFATTASAEALQSLALDDNPLVRGPAVEGLVNFNNTLLTNKMKSHLNDKNSRKRRRMAVAYLSAPSLNTDPSLFTPLLKDKDAQVRLDAVQAILQAPKGSVKVQLIYLLDDPYEDIRMSILRKLDSIVKLPNVNKRVLKQKLDNLARDPNPEVQTLVKRYKAMGY